VKEEEFTTEDTESTEKSGETKTLEVVATVPPLRGPTRQDAAQKKKSGRSGRDDSFELRTDGLRLKLNPHA
jgi:hypothetical protein